MGQNRDELLDCAKFIEELKPRNVLEVGTQYGASFLVWCTLSTGIRVSVDMPNGVFGGIPMDTVRERDTLFQQRFQNVFFVEKDSHLQSTVEEVEGLFKGDLVDFLFIDADHTYDGVSSDYNMYKKFVRVGGYIGFHDINKIEECQVDRFWGELVGEKIEFNYHQSWVSWRTNIGGIGVIKHEG
jgi:cephalosporin hydroxylase